MRKGIVGAGGFGREVYWSLPPEEREKAIFFVDDNYYDGIDENVKPLSSFNPNEFEMIVAVGDPKDRERIAKSLPKDTKFFTHVHPSVSILGSDVFIGEGSIVCAGSVLTTNIVIGKHAHLNLMTTIGHDSVIGDYFTTAPGAKISGNVKIGNRTYFGTNSCVKQKIKIGDDIIVGLNCGVTKDLVDPGVYIGTPATRIK